MPITEKIDGDYKCMKHFSGNLELFSYLKLLEDVI